MSNKKSKRYQGLVKDFDKNNALKLEDAVKVIKEKAKAKFVESFDVCFFLNVDKTKPDSVLRTTVDLPNGNGKKIKVAVICPNDKLEDAKSAGAEVVGSEDLIESISNGKINFDILIATPDMMSKVGKLGKVLGPKGLMPNPKTGTVTNDIKGTIENINKGLVAYKNDKAGTIHAAIGKISFDNNKIAENITSFIDEIKKNKPSGVKGNFVNSIYVSSTMGVGLKLEV